MFRIAAALPILNSRNDCFAGRGLNPRLTQPVEIPELLGPRLAAGVHYALIRGHDKSGKYFL